MRIWSHSASRLDRGQARPARSWHRGCGALLLRPAARPRAGAVTQSSARAAPPTSWARCGGAGRATSCAATRTAWRCSRPSSSTRGAATTPGSSASATTTTFPSPSTSPPSRKSRCPRRPAASAGGLRLCGRGRGVCVGLVNVGKKRLVRVSLGAWVGWRAANGTYPRGYGHLRHVTAGCK